MRHYRVIGAFVAALLFSTGAAPAFVKYTMIFHAQGGLRAYLGDAHNTGDCWNTPNEEGFRCHMAAGERALLRFRTNDNRMCTALVQQVGSIVTSRWDVYIKDEPSTKTACHIRKLGDNDFGIYPGQQ